MGLRSLAWAALGALLVVLPPYTFEKIAQHYYLIHSVDFWTYSGTRYYFDVAYLPLAAGVLGYGLRNYSRALVIYALSVAALVYLLFAYCQPILCYSMGPDGLESLRMGSFFLAEGLAAVYIGRLGWDRRPPKLWQELLSGGCAFYAVAYNTVIFTLAGAKVLAPFDPYAALGFLGALSLVIAAKVPEGGGVRKRVALPITSQAALLLVGGAMAQQYLAEVAPFAGWSLVAVALGASIGAALRSRNRVGRFLGRSPLPFVVIILFVFMTTVVIWPDEVAGHVAAASNFGRPSSYSYAIPLYAGGFMSSPMVRPTAVAVNVSLSGTDASSIPPGSFIGAGIGVHSADCCTDGIDYGYRFDLQLWRNGSESLVASAWRMCDANAACGGHSWKVLMYYSLIPLRASQGQPVRLTLRWERRTIVWQYALGSTSYILGSLDGTSRMNAAFNAGWLGPPDNPFPGGALFFQFGVTSLAPIEGSWSAKFVCPSVLFQGKWSCVQHAETMQGDQSYWKILWRWGEALPNVAATADPATSSVSFHNSISTMRGFVNLW